MTLSAKTTNNNIYYSLEITEQFGKENKWNCILCEQPLLFVRNIAKIKCQHFRHKIESNCETEPENNRNKNTKIITKKEYLPTLQQYNCVTWENIHIKLLIGRNGALFGSWNFYLEHETKATQRELMLFISPEEPLYKNLFEKFMELFETAGQWKK